MPQDAEPAWTGRLSFQVFSVAGHPLGEAELRVWRDVIDVWFGNICFSVLNRDAVRVWVSGDRRTPFICWDVTLLEVEQQLAIRLGDDQLPHLLPDPVAARLRDL